MTQCQLPQYRPEGWPICTPLFGDVHRGGRRHLDLADQAGRRRSLNTVSIAASWLAVSRPIRWQAGSWHPGRFPETALSAYCRQSRFCGDVRLKAQTAPSWHRPVVRIMRVPAGGTIVTGGTA